MGIPPIDLCVTSVDHLLLNVRRPNEYLRHSSPIAVFGDPMDSYLLALHKTSQIVTSSLCGYWLGSLTH